MLVARLFVSRTEIETRKLAPITAGMVGAEVEAVFDSTWDGFVKTFVWQHGDVTIDDLNASGRIPAEALAKCGGTLRFGVYGTKGGTALPTLWTTIGTVNAGADPSGEESTDPALPVWAQILSMIGTLDDLNAESKETIVAAINEALENADPETVEKIIEDYAKAHPAPVQSVNGQTGVVQLDAAAVGARPATWTPSAADVGADASGTAGKQVAAHNTDGAAHSDIRLLITELTNRLNAVANSEDVDLDQLSELVAYIKSNRELIAGITTSKVSVTDIVNDLVTNAANKPLSAAQGVVLAGMIPDDDHINELINTALGVIENGAY